MKYFTQLGLSLLLPLFLMCGPAPETPVEKSKAEIQTSPRPDCEWCGAQDAPEKLDWQTRIAPADEPGEPLVLSGTVFQADGKTPAPGILIYAYHTNQEGIYPKKGDETGNGQRHGYLRSWVRTNAEGQYKFTTIKPEPYPSRNEPAHIHMTLSGPDLPEYWIASTLFAGDPLLKPGASGDHILDLKQGEDGVLYGQRDIVLKE